MLIRDIIHDCINGINNKAFACTRAEYMDPVTQVRTPVIQQTTQMIKGSANTLVIFGDNASGKSLVCGLIESKVRRHYAVRNMCVRNRVVASAGRAFIFGNEAEQSTGETSIRGIQKALAGARSEDESSLIILDEPDLGLSAKYARALGRYLAQQSIELNARGVYVVIVSHSAPLLSTFSDELQGNTSFFGLNTTSSLNEWLESDEEKTIEELLGLTRIAIRKQDAIDNEMDRVKRNQ